MQAIAVVGAARLTAHGGIGVAQHAQCNGAQHGLPDACLAQPTLALLLACCGGRKLLKALLHGCALCPADGCVAGDPVAL